jgi:hypothetical protein
MSLLQGTLSLRRFLVLGPVPAEKDLQEGLRKDHFRPFEDGMEEERVGWCDWRNPLITPPEEAWVSQERFAIFGLRMDTRRVPATLLKAHVDLRLHKLMKEKDLAFIGKEARISLQDEVKVELLKKVLPTPRVVEVAWDLKGGVLWTTASSSKTQGGPASPGGSPCASPAGGGFDGARSSRSRTGACVKPLELVEQGRFLGEEFLLWLWMRGLAEGGTSGFDGDMSACFIDDAVMLLSERGDVKELSLRKGNPAESREAFEALSRGMRPSKAKARLLSGDMEWTFVLNAASLDTTAMKLPPSQAKDPAGRVADRLFLLEEGLSHLERRFTRFLELRTEDPAGLEEILKHWVRQGLSGVPDEVPWESD